MMAQKISSASSGPFITSLGVGSTRNDFDILAGYEITIGGANITVTELGRWVISGNSASHAISIISGATGSGGTTVGTVTVNTSGATASAFLYGTLGSPIVLTAGVTYAVVSHEVNGGDLWLNENTTTTTTGDASIIHSKFKIDGGTWNAGGSTNVGFVLPNFKYHL